MKKRPAKRIQKPQQITNEEKQLLELMASFIVEIMLRKKDDPAFDKEGRTENDLKWLIISLCSNMPILLLIES